jgi:hypothetical protein
VLTVGTGGAAGCANKHAAKNIEKNKLSNNFFIII